VDACFGVTSLLKNSTLDVEPYQSHDYLLKDLPIEVIAGENQEEEYDTNDCQPLAANASNMRIDSSYFRGLHYTGLMGSVCKHGMPLWFLNISHGKEKQIFGVKVLEHALTQWKGPWNVKYDIMCR